MYCTSINWLKRSIRLASTRVVFIATRISKRLPHRSVGVIELNVCFRIGILKTLKPFKVNNCF